MTESERGVERGRETETERIETQIETETATEKGQEIETERALTLLARLLLVPASISCRDS